MHESDGEQDDDGEGDAHAPTQPFKSNDEAEALYEADGGHEAWYPCVILSVDVDTCRVRWVQDEAEARVVHGRIRHRRDVVR